MGYYIQGPDLGKAEFIEEEHDGMIIPCPTSYDKVPDNMALICVISNGPFEAAAYCFNENEFIEFSAPLDPRSRKWVLMDLQKAQELSGYSK